MPIWLGVALTIFAIIAIINGTSSLVKGIKKHMSASFDKLSVDVKGMAAAFAAVKAGSDAAAASIATLTSTVADLTAEVAKLKAEAGTPDADLDALDAVVVAANPPATPPVEAPPAA